MATQLRIIGWKAQGLRCPDHEMTLIQSPSEDTVYPISLIQMPNGTGKTTALELLRAALSGAAAEGSWDAKKVRAFRKLHGGPNEGTFQVAVLNNDRRVTFTVNLDFEEGTVSCTTTLPSGMKHGFHPPRELERFLRPDFVNLFVFDGELASHLLNATHTDAEAAVEDLFQLKIFSQIAARVQDNWDRAVNDKGASEERGHTRRRNKVDLLKKRIAELTSERDRIAKEHENTKRAWLKKKNTFQAEIDREKAHSEELQTAQHALTDAEHRVELATNTVLTQMRNPHALSAMFGEKMITLKSSLDRAKLPERAAREFFEELADEEECVCGRALDDKTRQAIRDRAAHYLGSDDVSLLNAMKSDITDQLGPDPVPHEEALNKAITDLCAVIHDTEERRTERDAVEARAVRGHPELEKVREEIRRLDQLLPNLVMMLNAYEDPNDSGKDAEIIGIRVLRRRLKEAEHHLAEITETLELKAKSDVLGKILRTAQSVARQGLSAQICREANERIERLLPDNDLRIEKVEKCLKLQGREGGSVGETLSVAYAFLATLFDRTEHQLPFIVDSPAGALDLAVRPEVARLVPSLANQFIAFTISAERPGFILPLEEAADGAIQFLTLFRKGPAQFEKDARKCSRYKETTDGICVEDREFFCQFHLDSEE